MCAYAVAADAKKTPEQSELQPIPIWAASVGQSNAQFSCSLACAGDVNGDGFDDIIVGARNFTVNEDEEGAVFAYYGSREGLPDQPSWRASPGRPNADFGYAVASAGDVNGDGFSDVIIGSYGYRPPGSAVMGGAAFLYLGSSNGLGHKPASLAQDPMPVRGSVALSRAPVTSMATVSLMSWLAPRDSMRGDAAWGRCFSFAEVRTA